jgi:hypothetical protein
MDHERLEPRKEERRRINIVICYLLENLSHIIEREGSVIVASYDDILGRCQRKKGYIVEIAVIYRE